jgi:hypothetical protein
MKKTVLFLGLMLTIGAVSCKKDDDKGSSGSGSNTWTFKGVKYSSATVTAKAAVHSISAADGTHEFMISFLSKLPAASGKYKIVFFAPESEDEVGIYVIDTPGNPYVSTGNDNAMADITVSADGKLSVSVPEIWVSNVGKADSAKVSGTITETTRL